MFGLLVADVAFLKDMEAELNRDYSACADSLFLALPVFPCLGSAGNVDLLEVGQIFSQQSSDKKGLTDKSANGFQDDEVILFK